MVNHVITGYFQVMSIHYSKLFSKQCHWSPDTLVISVPVRAISLNLLSKLTAHLVHPFIISALCYTSTPLTNASSLCIFAITSCLRRCVAHYQDFDPLITTHRALSSWQTCLTGCQYMHARTFHCVALGKIGRNSDVCDCICQRFQSWRTRCKSILDANLILLSNQILLTNVPSGAMSHKPLGDYEQEHLMNHFGCFEHGFKTGANFFFTLGASVSTVPNVYHLYILACCDV